MPKTEIKIGVEYWGIIGNIYQTISGYHSYSKDCEVKETLDYIRIYGTGQSAKSILDSYGKEHDIHEAYIPKGTKYYRDVNGEFASETLVVKDKIVPLQPDFDFDVMVDDNGTLKRKKYNGKSDSNIVGVVFCDQTNPQNPIIISLLDEDWNPKEKCANRKYQNEFIRRYGNDNASIASPPLYNPSFIYRLKEIVTGSVDWNVPYYINGDKYNEDTDNSCVSIFELLDDNSGLPAYVLPLISLSVPMENP